jgi:hypothetical protein
MKTFTSHKYAHSKRDGRALSRRVYETGSGTITLGALALTLLRPWEALPVPAQITSASVSGSVRDGQGGVISGATVTLVRTARGTSPIAISHAQGDFVFPIVEADTRGDCEAGMR